MHARATKILKKNSLAYKYFSESVSYKSPKKIPKSLEKWDRTVGPNYMHLPTDVGSPVLIPVLLTKMNFASIKLVLSWSTRDTSFWLKSWAALFNSSTHAVLFVFEIAWGVQPISPSPIKATFLAPYLLYKVFKKTIPANPNDQFSSNLTTCFQVSKIGKIELLTSIWREYWFIRTSAYCSGV